MSVSSEVAGITPEHIADIERTCRLVNTFIFIRPSTRETMQLIREGYATKSMDIHDKSSDWGPASGFVPCDPAFCKVPPASAANSHPHYHAHGEAKPIHLSLTDGLATPDKNPKLVYSPLHQQSGSVRFVKAHPAGDGHKSKVFKLEKKGGGWEVYWLDGQTPVPLYVWGYTTSQGVKPVTGDYDLWMVAPHVSLWSQHTQVMGIKDSHGESGATQFITWLLVKLNKECGRADNHVFHHGAESQNYGFTQAIDPNLAMFTPAGTSEMVHISDLPTVLVDLQTAGYLVYWNKRYGERDPELMGNAVNAGVTGGAPGKSAIEALLQEAAEVKEASKGGMLGGDKAQALIQKNLLGRGGQVPKIQQIQAFHKALMAGMARLEELRRGGTLQKLKVDTHIPREALEQATGDVDGLRLQQQLQRAVVELSEMDHGFGKGERAATGAIMAPSPEKWATWEAKNQDLFRQLEQKFGRAGSTPLRFDRIPGTRAYKAADLPTPAIPDATLDKLLGPFAELFKKMFG